MFFPAFWKRSKMPLSQKLDSALSSLTHDSDSSVHNCFHLTLIKVATCLHEPLFSEMGGARNTELELWAKEISGKSSFILVTSINTHLNEPDYPKRIPRSTQRVRALRFLEKRGESGQWFHRVWGVAVCNRVVRAQMELSTMTHNSDCWIQNSLYLTLI